MVRSSYFLFVILLSPILIEAMAPKVRAEVNPALPAIKGQLQGMLSVYHSPSDQEDPTQAQMNQESLPLLFLYHSPLSKEERTLYADSTSKDVVSVYRFLLPLSEPGIYPLPSISIKVGQQWVRSIPSTYQVSPGPILPFLQLQAFISPSIHLFPGQRAKFVYRMTYNNSMELVVEQLPLLQAKGFEKIGSERIEEKELPRATMQEITQEVRATAPGVYLFEESRIEGKQVSIRDLARPREAAVLQDLIAPITVHVLPFPLFHQPFFFNGALAPIAIQAELLTKATLRIGDPCKLAVDLSSNEETLETFSPPSLICQVGFQGFFRIDSEVKMEPIDKKTRRYLYYLHPLTYHITAIPPIEVAAFDTQSKTYVHARSLPIPLRIEMSEEIHPHKPALKLPEPLANGEWRMQLSAAEAPLRAALLLPSQTVSTWTLHLRSLLFLMLCGALALLLQAWLRPKWIQWRMRRKPSTSLQLLQEGKWTQALLHKLYEAKWITSPDVPPETLSEKGKVGEIRDFLVHLEALRFAASMPPTDEKLLKRQAHQLYAQITRSS